MGSTTQESLNIAVVGGGLAGLALIIGLLPHKHIKVTIYESAPAFAKIGVGVAFGPNVCREMNLISPDILEGFKRYATGNSEKYPELADSWAGFRYGMENKDGLKKYGDLTCDLKGQGVGGGLGTRSCIHRARFLDELVALVPKGTAKFGKRLVGLDEIPGEGVNLRFADGEVVVADAVIGCDGVKSVTREAVFGEEGKNARPVFTGEYAYRALVPQEVAIETLGEELALNAQSYCGYGGNIMSYPVEHGKFINIAAVRQKGDKQWDKENRIIPSTTEDMVKDFEGWGSNIIDLISRFETKDKWGFFDIPHEQHYYRGNICLLGDSAHASTPHLGAGAGMAFEDAHILCNLLGEVRETKDLEKAFGCYDQVRRERTQNVIEASRKAEQVNFFQGEGIMDDFEKLQPDVEARYRWVWDFDLEATLVEAKSMFHEL